MEQLIELLTQIQELAGVGIDALKGAVEGGGGEAPAEGGKPSEGGPEGGPEGGSPAGAPGESGPPADEEPKG